MGLSPLSLRGTQSLAGLGRSAGWVGSLPKQGAGGWPKQGDWEKSRRPMPVGEGRPKPWSVSWVSGYP